MFHREVVVDLPCDVALEAADRFLLGLAFLHPSGDVLTGSRVRDHPGDHDVPERGVGLTVSAAIEAVALVLATTGIDGTGAAEVGEARFVAESLRIVSGGHEERRGDV